MASTRMKLQISTLMGFAEALSEAICSNRNTRLNNMAMIAALDCKEMPEILNQKSMFSATIAYRKVLDVLTSCKLKSDQLEEDGPLLLTYDRFKLVLKETKRHLVSINS